MSPVGASRKDGGLLGVGGINKRRRLLSRPKMLYIANDAHNLPRPQFVHWIGVVAQEDLLPDGVFVGEKLARESLVDRDHPWRSCRVVIVQVAPFYQRNLQRAKYSGADFAVSSLRPILRRRRRVPEDRKGIKFGTAPRGQCADQRSGLHARQRAGFFKETLIERSDRRQHLFHVPARHALCVLPAFRELE